MKRFVGLLSLFLLLGTIKATAAEIKIGGSASSGVSTSASPTWTGDHTWSGKMTLPSTVTIPTANLDISTTTDGTGNSMLRTNGTSEVVINERSGDIDFRIEADNNVNGFHFDAGAGNGQGGVGIGTTGSDKLNIFINSGDPQKVMFQNGNTGGFASWRARTVDTSEFVDFGVGGSAVSSPFTDAAYIYCESGLANGFKIFTNGSNVALSIDNNQLVTVAALVQLWPRTSAQIDLITPTAAGQLVYNSTLAEVCVSTGIGAGAFKTMGSVSLVTGFPLACR